MKAYSIVFIIGNQVTNVFAEAASLGEVFKAVYDKHGPLFNSDMSKDRFVLWCNLWWKEGNKEQSITVTEIPFHLA